MNKFSPKDTDLDSINEDFMVACNAINRLSLNAKCAASCQGAELEQKLAAHKLARSIEDMGRSLRKLVFDYEDAAPLAVQSRTNQLEAGFAIIDA